MNLKEYGLGNVCKTYHIDPIGQYPITYIEAKKLVVPERLDLIAKILYVDYYLNHRKGEFALDYYKRDLEVCTFGTFNEYGDSSKNSFADYCDSFHRLIESVRCNGMKREWVVPVDKNGIIMDGAHRTAVAAYFGLSVPIIKFDVCCPKMDADLYKKRLAKKEDIEFALTEVCKWKDDLYACCMWPAAEDAEKRERAIHILEMETAVLYRKTINITGNGLNTLIPQIYLSKDWIGSIDNRFVSAAPKIEGCSGNGKLDVLLFRADGLDHVKIIKGRMRDLFGLAENSLHITDDTKEALDVMQLLFNENSVYFLNHANPFYYIDLNKRIYRFKQMLEDAKADKNAFIIDSSTVMGLYGIRKPGDLDYLYAGVQQVVLKDNEINDHAGERKYHDQTMDDLIYNPNNYFYYFGLKIITLEILAGFKRNRNSRKDKEDLMAINSYFEHKHKLKQWMIGSMQVVRRKSRNAMFKFFRNLPGGGYEKVRDLYRFLKKRLKRI